MTASMRMILAAEVVRSRRGVPLLFPLAGLVLAAMNTVGWAMNPAAGQSWTSLMMWQTVYATGLVAMIAALAAGLIVRRERQARSGGTEWRSVDPRGIALGQVVIAAATLLVLDAVVVLTPVVGGMALGVTGAPLSRAVALVVALWVANLAVLFGSFGVARRFGWLSALGFGLAWQVAGVFAAEHALWWLMPWAWQLRPVLPLLGTHANGVPLGTDDPLVHENPLLSTGLALLLAVALMPWALRSARERRIFDLRARNGGIPKKVRGGLGRALVSVLRATAIPWLFGGVVLTYALIAVIYPPEYVLGLHGLCVLPMGSTLLAVLMWNSHAPAWRLIALRGRSQAAPAVGLLLVAFSIVVAANVIAACAGFVAGGEVAVLYQLGVGTAAGVLFVTVALWLMARFGLAVVVLVSLAGMVFGILFGGSVLAETGMWLAGPFGWAYSADTALRAGIAAGICVLGLVPTVPAWFAAARRHAAG